MKMEKKLSVSLVQEKQIKKKGFFMSNIKEREKFDDYEMLDEYNFNDGVRGIFYELKKIPVSLRLDNDIVLFFKKLASEQKAPYQTLINALLRKKLQEV
jgi:predicted DNA binding CopG/RHH family protein